METKPTIHNPGNQDIQIRNLLQQWRQGVEANRSLIPSKRVSALTLQASLQSPQLKNVTNELGFDYVSALISKAINEICVLTNSTLSADAIILIADTLTNDLWHLRIDEVLLVFRNGLKGGYGFSNKNFNAQIIFEWFQKHEQDREEYLYSNHLEKKNSSGNPNDRSPEARLAKDVFDEMVDAKVEKRIEAYKNKAETK